MHRRALTAALASATVALGGALAVTTAPSQAADPASPLVLDAPHRVVARSHDGWIYSNLGVRMIAQNEDFRIEANRTPSGGSVDEWWDPSYNSPITATWKRESGDVSLGEMTSWSGLDEFASIEIFRSSDGKRIRNIRPPAASTARPPGSVPTARPATPSRGAARGTRTRWARSWVSPRTTPARCSRSGAPLRLKPGIYEMVAGIAPEWREQARHQRRPTAP